MQLLHVGKKQGKKSHRLGKDFRGDALCFPLPTAASSKGGEGLWVWLACPDSLMLSRFLVASFLPHSTEKVAEL